MIIDLSPSPAGGKYIPAGSSSTWGVLRPYLASAMGSRD
jgi:hypothetical protein